MNSHEITKTIPLSQGFCAIVDAEDYEKLSGRNWVACKIKNVWYARSGKIYMHREIMGFPDALVDHRNGDGLDNRKKNLRQSDHSQNGVNARKRSGLSSRFKGVTWHKSNKNWRAQIGINGKNKHLGCFNEEEAAARAYDAAAKAQFGNFARLNFSVV